MKSAIQAALLTALMMGCATESVEMVSTTDQQARAAEGSLVAFGILDFLNDAGTTVAILDDDVPLNSRTAANVIAWRNGPDGVFGTADDNLFNSLQEVDDVSWVGPAALSAIETYVAAFGWVPGEDDLLGDFDGVSFTYGEAFATLDLANTAAAAFIDDDLGLDSRAVTSILDARPVADMGTLAGLYYVGGSALKKLRDEAVAPVVEPVEPYEDWFTADEEMDIPDGDLDGVTIETSVGGVPDIPKSLTLSVEFIHDDLSQLSAVLVAPDGSTIVYDSFDADYSEIPIEGLDHIDPNGSWYLTVVDDTTGVEGVTRGWAVVVRSL